MCKQIKIFEPFIWKSDNCQPQYSPNIKVIIVIVNHMLHSTSQTLLKIIIILDNINDSFNAQQTWVDAIFFPILEKREQRWRQAAWDYRTKNAQDLSPGCWLQMPQAQPLFDNLGLIMWVKTAELRAGWGAQVWVQLSHVPRGWGLKLQLSYCQKNKFNAGCPGFLSQLTVISTTLMITCVVPRPVCDGSLTKEKMSRTKQRAS